jgi:ATP-dependent HslUV protease ATP-binding subunit HslU
MVTEEEQQAVRSKAEDLAEERVLDALLPPHAAPAPIAGPHAVDSTGQVENQESREKLRKLLRLGELNDREIQVELRDDSGGPSMSIMTPQGVEEMGVQFRDLIGGMMPKRTKNRRMKVAEALAAFIHEEALGLVDMDRVRELAVERVEQSGIVFIDEIDKVATGQASSRGPDVSREGVQRDLLPIVEGSTVQTKQGPVRTDHILFIAAGAFHYAKPSDLIPELQGRFPIRVELSSLDRDDLVQILTEPQNSLVRQYAELMKTENITLEFEKDGIDAVADIAASVNERSANIGARRLHTVMEKLLDTLSFDAPDMPPTKVSVDRKMVEERLGDLVEDHDLSQYIL